MRGKSMILIVIALGCGLVASIGISQILDRSGSVAAPNTDTKKVYVAVKDVNISEVFDAEMMKLEEWPVEKVPEGAVTKLEDIVGLAPNQRLYAGEVIRKEKLVDPAKAGGKAFLIPKGYRVQAVKVTAAETSGNLITPGDHVDVQVYLRKGGNIPQSTTKTILEDVRVFAVNSDTSKQIDDDGKAINAKTVSLLVKPPQLQTLLLASRVGQISLSLRHPDDETQSDGSESARMANLLNGRAEDATPDVKVKHDVAAEAAKTAANDFKHFLNGLNQLKQPAPAANADQVAKVFVMEELTREGIKTWELQDTEQFSKAQVVTRSVAGFGADVPPAATVDFPVVDDDQATADNDQSADGNADDADGADSDAPTGDAAWNPDA